MPATVEAFTILLFLLPGFVGLIVYEIVAEVPKREAFDKVVVALALTVLATVIHGQYGKPAGLEYLAVGPEQRASSIASIVAGLGWTTFIAAILGMLFGAAQNRGLFYWLITSLRISKRTGAIDVWHQVFSRGEESWIKVRYKDGRLLMGWAQYYSEDSKSMSLFLSGASWHYPLSDDGKEEYVTHEVIGPGVLLVNFGDVMSIEQVTQ